MKLAFLFPGQGSQAVGMGKALAAEVPAAREAFETADRVLGPLADGRSFSQLCWGGPEDELRQTLHAQPALLTHSVAALRAIEERGVRPDLVAGHSLGEYSACVAARALDFEPALELVRIRGRLMHRAGTDQPGTMAAILGLEKGAVVEVCRRASGGGLLVVAANDNAPGQVVISGHLEAVRKACELATAAGAKRAIPLPVSAAFHSPLMASAAKELATAIERAPFRDAECPIVPNVSARPAQHASEIRDALERQLLGEVRWRESMEFLVGARVDAFVEIGTGRVLRGLLKSLEPGALSFTLGEPRDVEAVMGGLKSAADPAAREAR